MNTSEKINRIEKLLPALYERLRRCDICPRECHRNRIAGEKGYCGTDASVTVYTSFCHRGEELPISGRNGSGTLFFSGCSLRCIFCQNHTFSHTITGKRTDKNDLADLMLSLQRKGAHNINLVTPTHVLPQILQGLQCAYHRGLSIPIVYNTSGYEKKEIVALLEGIVDIYLADIKYLSADLAKNCSNAEDYPRRCREAVQQMAQQVSTVYEKDLLKQGLIIRHLVLPNHIDNSKEVLSWVKKNLPGALVSVMFQYRPYYNAHQFPLIDRPVNYREYEQINELVEQLDLPGWVQEFDPPDELAGVYFTPDNKTV